MAIIEPDAELRDTENVPLKEDIGEYFEREVKPHVPEAWMDESKTKIGYEIPFTRHFYEYTPPRALEESRLTFGSQKARSCGCWRRWGDETVRTAVAIAVPHEGYGGSRCDRR